MAQAETCAWCKTEVPPGQAREVRTALEHATMQQRGVYEQTWGLMPALLCARDFSDSLGFVNRVLFDLSEHSPSPL